MPEPPPANLDALTDLCTPWCIHVVATLRIAEHIGAGIDEISALGTCLDQLQSAATCEIGHVIRPI